MMNISKIKTWGVDIGNVLFWNLPENLRIAREADQISAPEVVKLLVEVPGAFQGLKLLVNHVGSERVWIISKASPLQEVVSRLAFESKFPITSMTGFDLTHLKFCRERIDKASIIKKLGIEGHIDDRGEVIASIQGLISCPIWFNPEQWDHDLWRDRITHRAILVENWQQILTMF